MNAAKTCWGIYRELAHSPGRIDADRAILESVGEALAARGFNVELAAADAEFDTHFANIFVMCERGPVLDRLRNAEKTGSIIVNSPDAIRNTYRHCMVELFARHQVSAPASQADVNSKKAAFTIDPPYGINFGQRPWPQRPGVLHRRKPASPRQHLLTCLFQPHHA